MKNRFINLARHDVVCISEDELQRGKLPETSRVDQLVEKIRLIDPRYEKNAIFSSDGLECEVLRPDAQGWQKGIVRVSVEFLPTPEALESEPLPEDGEQGLATDESPLDVIRQTALQGDS